MQIEIVCKKCQHEETEVVNAKVELRMDEQGRRIHRQTVYMLRCPACGHGFETVVDAETAS